MGPAPGRRERETRPMIEISTNNPACGNLTLAVRYEHVGDGVFRLREWSLSFDSPGNPAERSVGDWHRVHGNQRKPIGGIFAVRLQKSEMDVAIVRMELAAAQ